MSEIETTKVWLANFTTSAEAAKLSKDFLNHLGFTANYQSARLAIGRSLGEANSALTIDQSQSSSSATSWASAV